ncbi:unnamed protein product, partial [Tetraodon nigroviridis]
LCIIENEEFGPFFIHEPDDIIFPLDSNEKKVVMHCEARGNPAPTYRFDILLCLLCCFFTPHHHSLAVLMCFSWSLNRTEIDAEADYRYSIYDGNLIINNASVTSQYGMYQCKAENSFGTILSREALLQFAWNGPTLSWPVYSPLVFPEIIYSWVFNEFPSFVAEDSRRFISQHTGNLYISKVQPSDVGSYICLVKNTVTNARVLSPPTPLTLKTDGIMGEYEPKIEVHFPTSVLAARGATVRLECFALGNPVPTITWRKINGNIPKKARLRKSQAVLEIPNIQLEDSGTYECKAENPRGGTAFKGHLQVYSESEHALIYSCFISLCHNGVCSLLAFSGTKFIGASQVSIPRSWTVLQSVWILLLRNNTLRIVNSSRADEGSYVCRADNQFGSAEMTAVLWVKDAMRVELSPHRVEVTVGESVVLSCKATHDSSLDVTFQWFFNQRPITFQQDGGHFEYIQTVRSKESSTVDLMIRNILLKHAGRYGCRAQTSADTVIAEAELLVRGPPGPPGVVIVEEITDTTATLSWTRGLDNHSPISTYNLQARSPFSLGWQTVKTDPDPVTGDLESAMAVRLNPWVEYEFRVVATNAIGTGDPSVPSRGVRTKEAVPSVAPANVSGGNGRRHELVILWEPVSEEFQNGEGFGYIVAFRANGTRGWKEKMVTSADSTMYKYRDETFPPLTPFEVKVGVYNNRGDGPFSKVVIIHSAEGEPKEAPSDVKAYSISASEIRLTWKPSPGPGRPKGYEVCYWKDMEQQEAGKKQRTVKNETTTILTGLEGNTLYQFTVKGFNSVG